MTTKKQTAKMRTVRPVKSGRLPKEAHTAQPWHIHRVAPDFTVEDVWALPTPGGPHDFHLLISQMTGDGRPEDMQGRVGKFLFTLRWKLGEWFGWDKKNKEPGVSSHSLRCRLPADLLYTHPPIGKNSPFTPLYITGSEYASELANATMHGIMHLGWVKEEDGSYRGQMAVLVKPNGLLGKFYMALIRPFRYLIIYPALMRSFEQKWKQARGKQFTQIHP